MTMPAAITPSLAGRVPGGRREPAWLREAREQGLARFGELGLPTRKHEEWKYTSLSALAPILAAPAAPAEGRDPRALLGRAPHAGGPRLVFANGRFRADLSSPGPLPSGVAVVPLSEALAQMPERVRPHLGRLAPPAGDHALVALNAALFEEGAFVWLPAGVEVEAPIEVVWLSDAPGAGTVACPRLLVVAGEGARAAVAEVFLGEGADAYLVNAVTEAVLAGGARIEHHRLQAEGDGALHLSSLHAEEGAGARLAAHQLALGAALGRSEARVRLAGEGGEVALSGLYMGSGVQVLDNVSLVEHAVPRCTTSENYKGILDGKARGIFSGRIRVLPGAQKTQAYQMSSNLLLSDDATVDTRPQLEIFADDVKCGHGGTVGQIDETALFYLRSRGLDLAQARGLLIYAFASEMVDLVRPAALRAGARDLVAARLPAGARLLEAA